MPTRRHPLLRFLGIVVLQVIKGVKASVMLDHLEAVARKAEQTPMPSQPDDTEGEPLP